MNLNYKYILLLIPIILIFLIISTSNISIRKDARSLVSPDFVQTEIKKFKYNVPPRRRHPRNTTYAAMRAINEQRYNDASYKTAEEWTKIINEQRSQVLEPKRINNSTYFRQYPLPGAWNHTLIPHARNEYDDCITKYFSIGGLT